MAKRKKTRSKLNSMRVLEAQGIPYTVFEVPPTRPLALAGHLPSKLCGAGSARDSALSALEVAELAGVPPAQVYKTLVVERERGKALLVMVAADRELNLKRLAAAIGEKKLRMASQRDAERLTGLKVGGISALALLNRGFDVYIDKAAAKQSHVYISSGQRGVNLSLATDELTRVTGARIVEAS